MTKKDKRQTWLSYVNLSDQYERKARFLPSLLSIAVLLPISAALSGPLWGWLNFLVGGMGLAAVFAVGMSHMASAAGNRLQKELWPRWPHDSPTNRWLHPADRSRSVQQKKNWYATIKRLTGLDMGAALLEPQESVIFQQDSSRRTC